MIKNDPFGKKSPFPAIPTVTARDPKTGMKATALTRGGAQFKLEFKTGKKVPNPTFKRS